MKESSSIHFLSDGRKDRLSLNIIWQRKITDNLRRCPIRFLLGGGGGGNAKFSQCWPSGEACSTGVELEEVTCGRERTWSRARGCGWCGMGTWPLFPSFWETVFLLEELLSLFASSALIEDGVGNCSDAFPLSNLAFSMCWAILCTLLSANWDGKHTETVIDRFSEEHPAKSNKGKVFFLEKNLG